MEEEKAAAYYEELTRKGEGAARFKQGLGFSTSASNDDVPKPGSALASSSSFLSKFVKASSPSKASEFEKQAQVQSIQNKLKKKPNSPDASRVSERSTERGNDGRSSSSSTSRSRRRSRSRERYRERDRESRRRSRSRERHRHRDDERRRRRSRSRTRSDSDGDRRQRQRERDRERRGRSRSASPRQQRRSDKKYTSESDVGDRRKVTQMDKGKNTAIDYARLIEGYDNMSSAERVKAKMKLQLSKTAEQDSEKGVGWERFEFNKDAPLDDEEIEVAEDDAALVKHIGQSFRFSAVETKREEQIQAAHEEAMFGASAVPPPIDTDSEPERENEKEVDKKDRVASLLSETVLAKRKGSWRDRVREA